jgi:Icc-related predicted phosphoesterase
VLTIYYASDIHGSDVCWRKFLRAGEFYSADALIMGGDLAGKAIVPIEVHEDGTFTATFLGEPHHGTTAEELANFEASVRFNGFYPYAAAHAELARYRQDPVARDELFERVMVGEAQRWIKLGDQKSAETGIPIYVMAGNDDPWAFDQVLRDADRITSAEDGITHVGDHEMISCCYANPTPWRSPRELPEDKLYTRLKDLANRLEDPGRAIFNLHVPPHNTTLDTACQIDENFAVVTRGGSPVEIPVGSHAVRQIIEEFQPLLALHGHIHESRGAARIGRTVCLNPGSEYNSGRIHGVLVKLTADAVVSHQFVVG